MLEKDPSRVSRWYFGGLAGSGAACCTHPLDLLKVLLQTPAANLAAVPGQPPPVPKPPANLIKTTVNIVKTQGILALYNGLTASILRQLTYSTTRFAIYEVTKQQMVKPGESQSSIPFIHKVALAGVSGAAGGFVGTPADMINVRMQNDIKLPVGDKRNYKHAVDGLIQVYKSEGIKSLFNGGATATSRAVLMTIGQLSMYDQYKYLLLTHLPNIFQENLVTHFTSSLMAGATATTMTQPLDVMKTRMMNAASGEYKSLGHCASTIFKQSGLIGFYKGYVPAFVRLAPHTILMFIFFEQLRMRAGFVPVQATKSPS